MLKGTLNKCKVPSRIKIFVHIHVFEEMRMALSMIFFTEKNLSEGMELVLPSAQT